MAIDTDTVRKVAHLARIAVREDELAPLAAELNSILDWVEQLGEDVVLAAAVGDLVGAAFQRHRGDRRQPPGRHPRQRAGRPRGLLHGAESGGVSA